MRTSWLETYFIFALVLATVPTVARAQLDGQIIVDPANPAWLVRYDAGGDHRPLFMAGPGDPEDFLYRGSRNVDGTRNGDQWALINKLKPTGANSIYLEAVRAGGDGPADHNPFINSNPNSGLDQDILNQWDDWFTEMDNHGIVTYFFFYDDDAAGSYYFGGGDAVPANEQAFIQGIVDKFEHHKNLIWVVKEEYSEAYSAARVSNIAAAIRTADDHDHVIAVHQNDGISFDFANDPNIDQFAIQRNSAGADNIHDQMVSAWNLAGGRYSLNMSESNQHYDPVNPNRQATRRYSWATAMAGAYVMVLRDDILSTPVEILQDHGRIVEFFEQTDFNTMRPNDALAAAGTDYVLADGFHNNYIAYAADLVDNIGLVNMTAGQYDFLWFDVVTGATVQQNAIPVSSGLQSWSTPSGIGDELAVWISPFNIPEPPDMAKVLGWEFNTDGNHEGWLASTTAGAQDVSGGTWNLVPSGIDPMLVGPEIAVAADLATVVEIGMSSTDSNKNGQLFWMVEGDAGFSEARSQPFTLLGDGQMHTYRFDLSGDPDWAEQITQLRLDPVSHGNDGSLSIDFIRLLTLAIPGDFNVDGVVDGDDLAIWQTGFGTQAGATREQGDADGDADVDGNDFLRWQTSFTGPGDGLSAGSAVPEPASLLQIVAALVCMALGRCRTILLGAGVGSV